MSNYRGGVRRAGTSGGRVGTLEGTATPDVAPGSSVASGGLSASAPLVLFSIFGGKMGRLGWTGE